MVKSGPILVLLGQVFCLGLVCGLQWGMVPENFIYACAGSSVTFPWNFRVTDKETILSLNWIQDGAMSSGLVATMVRDHFMATSAFAGRVRRADGSNGGLVMEDMSIEDSGNYTLEVRVGRSAVYESLRSTVNLQVADGLMLKGPQLLMAQYPEAYWDQSSGKWIIHLTCGPFTFLGQPSVDVTWTTPDGKTLSSSGYESGHFYLSLVTPVKGGDYTCTIPPASLPGLCYREHNDRDRKVKLSAHVTVDETKARLSVLEANQVTVRHVGEELQGTVSSLEVTHEQDLQNVTRCRELTIGVQDQMDALDKEQQTLKYRFDHLNNISSQVSLTGPCQHGKFSVIDDPWRSSALGKTGPLKCDDDLAPGWYRFLLNGENAVIPAKCVPKNHCNTHASEWLDLQGKSLPAIGQEVSARTCAHWSNNCCRWEAPVTVRNCGMFYIYNLRPRSNCHLAHCVEPQ